VSGQKRVTIAGIINNNEIRIGTSVCSPKDQFVKHKGRIIAEGRALKHPEDIIAVKTDLTPVKTFIEYCKNYIEDFGLQPTYKVVKLEIVQQD
jgi:hypothetical protein